MNQERARQVFEEAKRLAIGTPWSDQLRKRLTEEEHKYIMQLWDTMPGNTCYVDAFLRIVNGRVTHETRT